MIYNIVTHIGYLLILENKDYLMSGFDYDYNYDLDDQIINDYFDIQSIMRFETCYEQ